jgi:hypothetical protein
MRFTIALLRAAYRGVKATGVQSLAVLANTPHGPVDGMVIRLGSLLTVHTVTDELVEDVHPSWVVRADVLNTDDGPLLPVLDQVPADDGRYAAEHYHRHAECGHVERCPSPRVHNSCRAVHVFGVCDFCRVNRTTGK